MKRYLVRPGQKVDLTSYDPDDTSLLPEGKGEARKRLGAFMDLLAAGQELLYAGQERQLLIVLQGMDTSGKDGTIRHAMQGFNPQGTRVVSFKKPSQEELDHDFLWRVHAKVPGKGETVVFNRSHYEDVLIVRVRDLVPKPVWKQRYQQIVDFERMLYESGTTILKFFLHISRDEQRKRLQARVDDPRKCWKFQRGDLEERKFWDEYVSAYEDALSKTSTVYAPWYVVPANQKWYRNHVVASTLADTFKRLDLEYPDCDVAGVVVE